MNLAEIFCGKIFGKNASNDDIGFVSAGHLVQELLGFEVGNS